MARLKQSAEAIAFFAGETIAASHPQVSRKDAENAKNGTDILRLPDRYEPSITTGSFRRFAARRKINHCIWPVGYGSLTIA
jgi:hypothetical protein